jgi:hypothetical protein
MEILEKRLSEQREQIDITRRCLALASECLAKAGPWKPLCLVSRPYAVARNRDNASHKFKSGSAVPRNTHDASFLFMIR